MERRYKFFILLIPAFLFRLGFGLTAPFRDPDAIQIYLLGLKFYTTGSWPYFGPDVVWGEIQIPGALQALLVGLPLHILAIAEAPCILLNVISFSSLCLLAWYCCKRLPELPRWFVWTWLLTSPWTLNLSTHIYNPSYLLVAGILFFVGVLEIYPFTTRNIIGKRLASAMVGFSLFWAMQIHLSWTVLVPYLLIAIYFQAKSGLKTFGKALIGFVLGAIVSASVLVPTYLKYGFSQGLGGTNAAIRFNSENLLAIAGILKRSLSFAVFDITSFIGGHTVDRIAFFKAQPWLIPFVVVLLVFSIAQGVALIACWFRKDANPERRAIKYLLLLNICLIYLVFLFSLKPPQTNHLYITFPIPMIYSLYCWDRFLRQKRWQQLARVFLVCGVIFHIGLGIYNFRRVSLYTMRAQVQEAINKKDYRVLGERRPNTLY